MSNTLVDKYFTIKNAIISLFLIGFILFLVYFEDIKSAVFKMDRFGNPISNFKNLKDYITSHRIDDK